MKTWDDWSDFDLSYAVSKIIYPDTACAWCDRVTIKFEGSSNGNYDVTYFNINNPADIWPIIFENRINLNAYDDPEQGWSATTDTSFFVDSDNPLRAAAIVFLMMNGVKSE